MSFISQLVMNQRISSLGRHQWQYLHVLHKSALHYITLLPTVYELHQPACHEPAHQLAWPPSVTISSRPSQVSITLHYFPQSMSFISQLVMNQRISSLGRHQWQYLHVLHKLALHYITLLPTVYELHQPACHESTHQLAWPPSVTISSCPSQVNKLVSKQVNQFIKLQKSQIESD